MIVFLNNVGCLARGKWNAIDGRFFDFFEHMSMFSESFMEVVSVRVDRVIEYREDVRRIELKS